MATKESDAVTRLRQVLENEPAMKIENAATAVGYSIRTLYRRKNEFEWVRKAGHLYFTTRSVLRFLEMEQYNPTALYDLTKGK